MKIDESLEPADIAALADAGLTGYHAAAKVARRLTRRDRCVVIGAGGPDHGVVADGENIDVPTIDIVSTEINFIGDLGGPTTNCVT